MFAIMHKTREDILPAFMFFNLGRSAYVRDRQTVSVKLSTIMTAPIRKL